MEDITQRLRLSRDSESVERERYMACGLFHDSLRDRSDSRIGRVEMQRMAKQAIEAACVFWEEWDIAVLTPDVSISADDEEIVGMA